MATVIVNRSSKEATLSRAVIKKIVDYVCELENREILGKLSIAFVSLDEIRACLLYTSNRWAGELCPCGERK